MGKLFNKGLIKNDKKEGPLCRLRIIEDINEGQLELFIKANETSRLAKNKSDYNFDNIKFGFCKFYRDFQNFQKGHWVLNTRHKQVLPAFKGI